MGERLQRTQILLEPGQHEALTEMARRQGRSLSDLVREIIRLQLAAWQHEIQRDDKLYQQMLDGLRRQHEEILAERGGRPIDVDVVALLEELRQEQDVRNTAGLFRDVTRGD